MKTSRTSTKLKEVQQALERMPFIWKKSESQFEEEMRFAKKIFGSTVKEILKYRLTK